MKNRQRQRRISLNENYHNGNKYLSNSYNNNNNNNNIDIQIFTNTKEPNQVNLNSYLASATVITTRATTTSSEGHNPCPISASPATDTATEIPQEKEQKHQQQETYFIMSPTIAADSSSSISSIATYYSSAKLRKSHSTPILQYCDGSNVGQHATDSKKVNVSCGLASTHQQPKLQQQHQHHHDQFSRFIGNESGNTVKCNNNSNSNDMANATPESLRFGCTHYKRRAMFVTPCCSKFYKCRFCHDESESHHFDRKTLTELICSECNTRQKVQEQCEKCGVRFGKYTCLICNLFDDADKQQFHCHGCGICRIGGADNFFHCEVCNMCLPIQLKIDGHRCVENISRSNCPVCLGDIHTSRIPCHIPDCGHLLHKLCFDQLLASGHYTCPTCQTSLIDMTALWEYLDAQALRMPVSLKYENQRVHIFCNDCHKTSKTKFHFIGLKCVHCGAYNTTQDVKRRLSLVTDEPSSA
ncbi:RING finger and CHY zinc finger domain-containing protein 1 [Drosophila tropicalis]|uniref:RING finger and CHY zinc finger domain-containing protein 1 n=1 Tax=Drosophila tropicalis TaxID=46794 RepID=UPI0035ABBE1F